jgi:cation-dependent mannose-6-phosphate receptor
MLRLVLLGLGCLPAEETACTLHDSGKYFDLDPLKSRYVRYAVMERQDSHNCLSSKDYESQTPGGHTLTINACRSKVREPFGLRDVNEKDSDIGGFVRHDHVDFSIGCV